MSSAAAKEDPDRRRRGKQRSFDQASEAGDAVKLKRAPTKDPCEWPECKKKADVAGVSFCAAHGLSWSKGERP